MVRFPQFWSNTIYIYHKLNLYIAYYLPVAILQLKYFDNYFHLNIEINFATFNYDDPEK